VAEIARERGVDPVEAMLDLAIEKDLERFFVHPVAVVTFSDSGAHVSQIIDSSLQIHLLSHWVRERQAFTLEQAVRMLTLVPATHWGFSDRGLVREGFVADLLAFDSDTIASQMPEVTNDLPAGARRLVQRARGIAAPWWAARCSCAMASTRGAARAAPPGAESPPLGGTGLALAGMRRKSDARSAL